MNICFYMTKYFVVVFFLFFFAIWFRHCACANHRDPACHDTNPYQLGTRPAGLLIFLTFLVCLSSFVYMAHVFVYGTLKKGQPNHYRLFDSVNGKAEFLASACTTQTYPLVIADKFNIPFLLNIPGQGRRIQGEIYKVDNQMLKFLDAFEDIPTKYQRTLVQLEVKECLGESKGEEMLPAGSITEAFVYSTTAYQPDWPSLPHYESYDAYGAHGLHYMPREARD